MTSKIPDDLRLMLEQMLEVPKKPVKPAELSEFDYDVPDGVPYLRELADEVLCETPDHLVVQSADITKLRKAGFGALVKSGGVAFTDWDSTSIFFDQNENRVLYGVTDELGGYAMHKTIMKQIDLYRHYADNFELVEDGDQFGLQATKTADRKRVAYPRGLVRGVGFKSKPDFEAYLNFADWTKAPFYREQTKMILGRYWENTSALSFWSTREEVVKEFKLVEMFLHAIKLTHDKVVYQFAGSERVYLYSELGTGLDPKETLSPEEIGKLRRQQHIDPAAKKKLAAIDQVKQVVSPGFDFQAQRNAMMPAVAEATITEDPNRINVGPGQTTTLGAKGVDVAGIKRTYFDSDGTISFIYDRVNNVMIFNRAGSFFQIPLTHPDIGEEIMTYMAYPDRFEVIEAPVKGMVLQPSLDDGDGPGSATGEIFFPSISSESNLKKYLKRLRNIMPLDGDISRGSKKFLMGRLWTKEKVISFWKNRAETLEHLGVINSLVASVGLKPQELVYEFLDVVHLFTYDELQAGSVQTRSSAEQQASMAQQHFKKDDAARKNWKMKKDSGFEFQAKKNAALPALQETPDAVYSPQGAQITTWGDRGAEAFIATSWYSILLSQGTHHGIMKYMHGILSEDGDKVLDEFEKIGGTVSNRKAVIADIQDKQGYLGQIFAAAPFGDYNIRDEVEKNDHFILGRLWTATRLIALWNEQSVVLENWGVVKNMFYENPKLGKLNSYRVDFVEREAASYESGKYPEFTPASDVEKSEAPKKPSEDTGGQINMITQLFAKVQELPKISDDKLKKIREKLHVLDPNVKAQVAKMLGTAGTHKAAAIAAKLGMSVAEFNHLWNMNEGVVNENPDTVYDVGGRRIAGYNDGHDAFAFITTSEYSVMEAGSTHYDMTKFFRKIFIYKDEHDSYVQGQELMDRFDAHGGRASDERIVIQDIQDENGYLGQFYTQNDEYGNIRVEAEDGNNDFLVGRVWPSERIISFWNDQHTVLTEWSWIQKMFKDHKSTLGDLKSYRVDFIERDETDADGKYSDLTPASDIGRTDDSDKPMEDSSGQLNMIAQLFAKVQELPKLADDKLKKIREKMHVLDPNVKAQVAKMLGHAGQHKAAAIAAKLGMSTAEFNHLWNINEGNIKLTDLLQ